MTNYEEARQFYDYIIKNNGYKNMSMLWTISCLEDSLQAYDMDLITSEADKQKMCNLILSAWLETEVNIGISKISDIVVENWQDLKDDEEASETMQELINDEVLF